MKERIYITTDSSKQSIILNKIPVLHLFAKISYSVLDVAKSIAEPENSNNLYTANDSTPLTRAFFVRSLRTPKINLVAQIERLKFNLSMVERNGKGSPFAVFRVSQFLSPLRSTAQTLRSLAVVPKNFYTELSQMFYKFLFIGSRLHITVYARNLSGHSKKQACEILLSKGMLQKGEKGYFMTKLPHKINSNRPRCFLLYPLDESHEEEQATQ